MFNWLFKKINKDVRPWAIAPWSTEVIGVHRSVQSAAGPIWTFLHRRSCRQHESSHVRQRLSIRRRQTRELFWGYETKNTSCKSWTTAEEKRNTAKFERNEKGESFSVLSAGRPRRHSGLIHHRAKSLPPSGINYPPTLRRHTHTHTHSGREKRGMASLLRGMSNRTAQTNWDVSHTDVCSQFSWNERRSISNFCDAQVIVCVTRKEA